MKHMDKKRAHMGIDPILAADHMGDQTCSLHYKHAHNYYVFNAVMTVYAKAALFIVYINITKLCFILQVILFIFKHN